MVPRYEQTTIENMSRDDCVKRLWATQGDRGGLGQGRPDVKGHCIGASGYVFPREIRTPPPCAHAACGWDLPNRRRV